MTSIAFVGVQFSDQTKRVVASAKKAGDVNQAKYLHTSRTVISDDALRLAKKYLDYLRGKN
jgi:hypothetical protein